MIKIKRGLDLPITGAPDQSAIQQGKPVKSVAVIGFDYVGMKPTMEVKQGDKVKLGQLLFADKKTPGVKYTAPAGGHVSAINRGEKRALQSVVIEIAENEEAIEFPVTARDQLGSLSREAVQENLIESGVWPALRTRPFSKVPAPGTSPKAIFVNAMDSNPLAANPEHAIGEASDKFEAGLEILARLTDGKVYVCKAPGAKVPTGSAQQVQVEEFEGPHPAGLSGTHVHFLNAASAEKLVWTIGYQDVIGLGHLFTTGRVYTDRVIAIGGPRVKNPKLVRTRTGASVTELLDGELESEDNRIISGSVLGGRKAHGAYAYLGRYHNQIAVIREDKDRGIFEYLWAGRNKHSVLNIFTPKSADRRFDMTSTTNGSPRAMVPVGAYEKVMPLDILPTQLLRAIIVGDTATAQELGVMELDEEDLALCTYVCPGKYEYGPLLRDNLTRIENEG